MPLTEANEFSSATVREFGHVEVRIDTVVRRGEEELSRIPHRHVLAPGANLSNEHPRVQEIAAAAWTPAVVATYRAMKAATAAKEG